MQKNVAGKWVVFAFQDEGGANPGEPVTGDAAYITANIRIDGGAANAVDDTNPTELEDGYYVFDITADETNGDLLLIVPECSNANVNVIGVPGAVWTTPPNFNTLGIESDGDVTQVNNCVANSDMRGTESAFLATSAPTNFSDMSITASSGKVTVGTNDDKTGYSISGSKTTLDDLNDIADTDVVSNGAITTLSGAVVNVDTVDTCSVNSDMRGTDSALLAASAPSNFGDLAITASTGKITVGTNDDKAGYSISGSKTTLDDLNDIVATDIVSAGAITTLSGAVVNVDTVDTCSVNSDMRGTDNSLLAASAPSNFGDLAITASTGRVTVGTNNDKTGYSISGTKTTLDALNDVAATDIVSAGAITTLSGAVVNVDTVDTCTTNTDMRGTDSALLASSAPANFGDLSISSSTGYVTVGGFLGGALTEATGGRIAGNFDTFFENADAATTQTVDDIGSGGGGGGDATAANQATIIDHLTDVKGTSFVKDTHSLTDITADVTGLNGDAMRGTDSALLAASAPANFGDLDITASTGKVTVGVNDDKSGYTISGSKTTLDALNDISAASVYTEFSSGSNEDAFKADVSGLATSTDIGNLNDFDPSTDVVARVTLVDTTSVNSDMRGTDNALLATSAPANFGDLAITVTSGKITVGTNDDKSGYSISGSKNTLDDLADISASDVYSEFTSGSNEDVFKADVSALATSAEVSALHNFDPANDTVARVTLVDTTTVNSDMRGTDNALLAASVPTNFADMAISASDGKVTVGTNDDKSGYSISGTITTLDDLDTQQDLQHAQTQSDISGLNVPSASDIVTAIMAGGDVDGFTLEESLKICMAALAGKVTGAGSTTITFRAADDSKNRIVATVTGDGNRTSLSLDATG